MSMERERPKVGVGVMIERDGKVLLGLRKSEHGSGTWTFPGGHLEQGERWEECATRETEEETGLALESAGFAAVTNDIFETGKHYVTILMRGTARGEPELREPDKFERWEWFPLDSLPEPLFLATANGITKVRNS